MDLTLSGGYFTFRLPENREEHLSRHTHKITGDITDIFYLLSNEPHTELDQDGKNNNKYDNENYA